VSTVVVVHAHPDDEAIFTGGTIALLAAAGHRVVVVYATSGELGVGAGPGLAEARRDEARAACNLLGAERVVFLDHHDSGTSHDPRERPLGAFAGVSVDVAADHLAAVVEGERADALVTYDSGGVYPHPDHVHAHRVGSMAAGLVGLLTWYEVTVDREYLHFVDTHVAALAGESIAPMLELGSPTVEITNTVDVRGVLGLKLAAIAEHRTQVVDPTFGAADSFPEVYGYEWFIRHGRPGPIDALTAGAAGLRRPAWRRGQTLPVGR
jgi:LmbE family N-acetylglucosaminyl deacetylase